MKPKEIVLTRVVAFNRADADALAALYLEEAVNHLVVTSLVTGKNVFEDSEWAILEWKDPLGLRIYGFFHIKNNKIIFQRGYWDRLSFLRQNNLPIPKK